MISLNKKHVFALLALVAGIIILFPSWNFQSLMAQGDHGRDLYAFKKTAEGAAPYLDYQWEYGPLMPYYYAAFLKIFGTSIQSVLLGQTVLVLLCGIMFYLAGAVLLSPFAAFVATLWFFVFRSEFFYTYNHIGAIFFTLVLLWYLFKYFKTSKDAYVLRGSCCLFFIGLIRPNISLSSSIAFFLSLFLWDAIQRKKTKKQRLLFYFKNFFFLLAALLGFYALLLFSLPHDYLKQCFHYAYSAQSEITLWAQMISSIKFLSGLLIYNFTGTWLRRAFLFSALLALLSLGIQIKREIQAQDIKPRTIALFSLVLFMILNLHEFFINQAIFRLSWSIPFFIMLLFLMFDKSFALSSSSRLKNIFFLILAIAALLKAAANYKNFQTAKDSNNLLSVGQTHVYTGNSKKWIETVQGVCAFIESHVPPEEPIFAIPYDPIYYFLCDRDSASRELFFFKAYPTSIRQQKNIIAQLKKKHVNYIIVSNRAVAEEPLLGLFGRTHCVLLFHYVNSHYQEVAHFGNWEDTPGWRENHAVKILKKIK